MFKTRVLVQNCFLYEKYCSFTVELKLSGGILGKRAVEIVIFKNLCILLLILLMCLYMTIVFFCVKISRKMCIAVCSTEVTGTLTSNYDSVLLRD